MKTPVKFLFLVVCITMIAGCQKDQDFFQEEIPAQLKGAYLKVYPSTATDLLTKAEEDWFNINDAIQNATPGETVQLAKGLFYLHKSIVCWDFNGTLKGSGMDETTIQTAPGMVFDRSACPDLKWPPLHAGHSMLCFPHQANSEERTVTVCNLKIVIDEPCDIYYRKKTKPVPEENNTLMAINVYYEDLNAIDGVLDLTLSRKIDLNVLFKNLVITGEMDDQYLLGGYSIRKGLAAFGNSTGNFEAKNVRIKNAKWGIESDMFCGESSTVNIKNCVAENCLESVYSFLVPNYVIINNTFKDISGAAIKLYTNNPVLNFTMPENGVSVLKNNVIEVNSPKDAIETGKMKNVQAYNNAISGNCLSGIAVRFDGDNWSIKNNNLCNAVVSNPEGATILLDNSTNCEVLNNANQVVGGSSATDPTNLIGSGKDCK
ncbi:MAG: right-handed parallel beta-helix repeat-containing protein [Mariniphaga sp.]|jgi:hypothetical protein|nr:right-handed parallel beta-helix repeat-containing protein [Mariniphaga sp.]